MARPSNIENLRKQIENLRAQREEAAAQTRSRGEVSALIDAMVTGWTAAAAKLLTQDLARSAQGVPIAPLTVRASVPTASGVASISLDLGPLLTAMVGPERIKDAFSEALAGIPPGLDNAKRLERLSAFDAELDALEIEEEGLIVASAGTIERRADARPEIILAGAP